MRKIIFLLTLILTSLLVIGNENLPKKISKISLTPGNYSLIVKKINSDEVWQKNSDQSFNFASVNKILTSIIAFDLLGPEFQFKTKFFTNGEIKEGVLEGDLIIKGEGNPVFSYNDLEQVLRFLQLKGITSIDGDVLLDYSYFDDQQFKLIDQDAYRAYNVFPSPLIIEAGAIGLDFFLTEKELLIQHNPAIKNIKLINNIKVTAESCRDWKSKLTYGASFENNLLNINLSGSFSEKCQNKSIYLNLINQSEYFALIFQEVWSSLGGNISGVIQKKTKESDLDQLDLIYEHYSEPLNQLVFEMNKYSLNLFSRNLALIAMREGSQLSPNEFNTNLFYSQWLQEKNINGESFYLENGAGLSRESYATTQFFLDVLDYIHKSKYSSEIKSSMPIVGIDGTLKTIFKGELFSGSSHIKTGSLKDVYAFAGFLISEKNEEYIIILVTNKEKYESSVAFFKDMLKYFYKN